MELINTTFRPTHKFISLDKYKRSLFAVRDDGLTKLYNECMEAGKPVSLYYETSDDDSIGELIMVVSNYSEIELPKGDCIRCAEYKGSVRFYINKSYEWTS